MNNTRVGNFAGGYYNEESAARVAGIGVGALRDLVQKGEIATRRADGVVLYSRIDIRRVRDARPKTDEEALLDRAFNGAAEARAESESMARENGHVVSREHAARNPGETATSKMRCTCGWMSPWLRNSLATDEKRAHLKAAVFSPANRKAPHDGQ